jgi:membrane-bound serine protease (ClpP class)
VAVAFRMALVAIASVGWALSAAKAAPPDEPAANPRMARLFKIDLPITGTTTERLKSTVRDALKRIDGEGGRPVLVFEFDVPKGQSAFGRGSELGAANDLARVLTSAELSGIPRIAYVPSSVEGHAILAILACDTIMMTPEAEMGDAGVDEPAVGAAVLDTYREVAEATKSVPVEVALKLVDRSRQLLQVKTEDETRFTTPAGLRELERTKTVISSEVVSKAGQAYRFSGAEARKRDLIGAVASSRIELARALGLPPEAIREEMVATARRPVLLELKGMIARGDAAEALRMVATAVNAKTTNFICVRIDSPGGAAVELGQLANYLADLNPAEVRTAAYIAGEARGAVVLVALACDQVVVAPGVELGGPPQTPLSPDEIEQMTTMIRDSLSAAKSRSWSLSAALIDPKREVFACRRAGVVEYFGDEELAEQNRAGGNRGPDRLWTKGERVTTPGHPFTAKSDEAVKYRLANRSAKDFADFTRFFGLEKDLARLEPGWADQLIRALAHPFFAFLLLMIGGAALYAELHSPGIGIGAFIAVVCFVLFFWSHILQGGGGWLAVSLFLTGLACVALEIFIIPGFAIFGLGGGALILVSLILASQTFIIPRNPYEFAEFQKSLTTVAGAALGVIVAIALINRWLPHTPVLGQIFLAPPSDEENETIRDSERMVRFDDLLGARGTTSTPLMPGGKARFGRRVLDVVTDGDFVPLGAEVVVAEVHGNRIVVRPVEDRGSFGPGTV